jgi:hypothetical protein
MKSLEKIFFTACIDAQERGTMSLYAVFTAFEKLGFSGEKLACYLKKWKRKGFYIYCVNMYFGNFDFDKLNGKYREIYDKKQTNGNYRYFEPFEFTKEMMIGEIRQGSVSNLALQHYLEIHFESGFTTVRVPSDKRFKEVGYGKSENQN